MERQRLDHSVMHCDETVVQILKEPDKQASIKSYMWVRVGGPSTQPIRLFHYAPSRAAGPMPDENSSRRKEPPQAKQKTRQKPRIRSARLTWPSVSLPNFMPSKKRSGKRMQKPDGSQTAAGCVPIAKNPYLAGEDLARHAAQRPAC